MSTSTQITVVGRVVSDITTRVTQAGDKVANFRIACQERRYDKSLGTWVDGDRMYVAVVCWRNLADHVADSLSKGDQIVANGRMKLDEYETKEGTKRTDLVITANAVGPDLALHRVTVNRPDWAVSPNQQTLITPQLVKPTPEDPSDQNLTQEEVAQAA